MSAVNIIKRMKFNCAYSQLVPVGELKPNPKNPNRHSEEQIMRLGKIIEYQGQRAPIVVSKRSGLIVKGHGRLEAIKRLGWEKAAVDYQDYESDDQEYADLVADNAIAEWAELDLAAINEFVPDLGPDFDLDLLGLKDFKLDPPNFEPGTIEDQGQLDQKKLVIMECPHCGESFEKDQAKIIN